MTHPGVSDALRRGDYLRAYDLAERALVESPDDEWLRHRAVLTLARTGSIGRALRRFSELGLEAVESEEVLALRARLFKDQALSSTGDERARALERSIEAYIRAWEQDRGYFPAINVATLSVLAGRTAEAREWAERALGTAQRRLDEDGYYAEATRAEALLILGRLDEAGASAREAARLTAGNHGAHATTARQLRLLCHALDVDPGVATPLTPPAVLHYTGHRVAAPGEPGRFPADQLETVRQRIAEAIDRQGAGFAIGSLAAGADILVAEAMLDAGGELDVVLPFDRDEFVEISVRPSGDGWVDRFHACLARASAVHSVTEDRWLGDDDLFNYATEYALGLARLRSRRLSTEVVQLAIWDEVDHGGALTAGTARDIALGRQLGFRQEIIPVRPSRTAARPVNTGDEDPADTASDRRPIRQRRTMLFGDFKGFSALPDEILPHYVDAVLGGCARVLERHEAHLRLRNTWGDGIFLVFDDLRAAADCAFDLQSAVAAMDRKSGEIPDTFGLRLGMHYGPVYEQHDPVLGRLNYFGRHVSRAARIEPITPEGEVYVTEQTAAAMAVGCADLFRCEYVGRVPMAKDYGELPMYLLQRE